MKKRKLLSFLLVFFKNEPQKDSNPTFLLLFGAETLLKKELLLVLSLISQIRVEF